MPLLPRRRLRAPQEDGTALIDPPLAEIPALIAANQAIGREFDRRAGLSADFRATARQSIARTFAANSGSDPTTASLTDPVIMTGHQPELFHPGVWFKNFLVSAVANRIGGTAINLVVDNDIVGTPGIRVPKSNSNPPLVVEVPMDSAGEQIPWEARAILDENRFQSFAEHVTDELSPNRLSRTFQSGIILNRLWPEALAAAQRQKEESRRIFRRAGIVVNDDFPPELLLQRTRIGSCLAAGRHLVEQDAKLKVADYELSWLQIDDSFFLFIEHLFSRHQELHAIYNQVLAEYRLANAVRSNAHPVPDLESDGEWLEVPFWLWTTPNKRRRRVFLRQVEKKWELTDRVGGVFRPSPKKWREPGGPCLTFIQHDIALRPRALITTMYARLVLSDLFIHGIGGAKYDEVTDEIIRRFFGIEPPKYVTATATFRLPIDRPQVTIEDVRENQQRQRDVRYRPESFVKDPLLAGEPALQRQLAALAAEKKEYVAKHALRRSSPEVFRGLDKLNRAMSELLAPVEQHLAREQARLAEDLRIAGLLGSREFSFVLYPEEYLVPRLLELSRLPA